MTSLKKIISLIDIHYFKVRRDICKNKSWK